MSIDEMGFEKRPWTYGGENAHVWYVMVGQPSMCLGKGVFTNPSPVIRQKSFNDASILVPTLSTCCFHSLSFLSFLALHRSPLQIPSFLMISSRAR